MIVVPPWRAHLDALESRRRRARRRQRWAIALLVIAAVLILCWELS